MTAAVTVFTSGRWSLLRTVAIALGLSVAVPLVVLGVAALFA